MQKVIKSEQRANVIGVHTPREGAERSQDMDNDLGEGFDSRIQAHPKLETIPAGNAPETAPNTANNKVAENQSQKSLDNVPVPSAQAKNQLTNAAAKTMAPKPTPHK